MRLALSLLAVVAALFASVAPAAAADWTTPDTIDPLSVRPEPDGPSVALQQGSLYIAVAGADPTGIYLLTNRSGAWQRTRITQGPDVQPSIAVDARGKVHIAFARLRPGSCTELCNGALHYATDRSGFWKDFTVRGGQNYLPSIAVRPGGRPSISYLHGNSTGNEWSYQLSTPSGEGRVTSRTIWTRVPAYLGTPRDYRTSIAVKGDRTYVAFIGQRNAGRQVLRVFEQEGNTVKTTFLWHGRPRSPALAVDDDDNVHVAFVSGALTLYHAWLDANGDRHATWPPPLPQGARDVRLSIAAWGAGKVAIVGERDITGGPDGGTGQIVHWSNATGSWTGEVITDGGEDHVPAIVVRASGAVEVVFLRGDDTPQLTRTSRP